MREEIHTVFLNVMAAEEHVNEVERSIRIIKERIRCQLNHLLRYLHYPQAMLIRAVTFVIKALNSEFGASKLCQELLPMTLVTGVTPPPYNESTELSFGDYIQAHNAENVTNTTSEGMKDSITLYPSGNRQGGWKFLSLIHPS